MPSIKYGTGTAGLVPTVRVTTGPAFSMRTLRRTVVTAPELSDVVTMSVTSTPDGSDTTLPRTSYTPPEPDDAGTVATVALPTSTRVDDDGSSSSKDIHRTDCDALAEKTADAPDTTVTGCRMMTDAPEARRRSSGRSMYAHVNVSDWPAVSVGKRNACTAKAAADDTRPRPQTRNTTRESGREQWR
jgi:hypothetical protein